MIEVEADAKAAQLESDWASSAKALVSSQQAATSHLAQATQVVESLRAQLMRTRGQLQQERKTREEKSAALARAEARIKTLLGEAQALESRLRELAADHAAALEEERRRAAAELEADVQRRQAALKALEDLELEWRKKLADAIEAEVEKRILHLQQVGAKKIAAMMQRRAFGPWHELAAQRRRRENMLRKGTVALLKPGLVATFGHWRMDWQRETSRDIDAELTETAARLKALQARAPAAPFAVPLPPCVGHSPARPALQELYTREREEWERNSRGSLDQIFQLTEVAFAPAPTLASPRRPHRAASQALKASEARDREQDLIISQLAITQARAARTNSSGIGAFLTRPRARERRSRVATRSSASSSATPRRRTRSARAHIAIMPATRRRQRQDGEAHHGVRLSAARDR